jgi:hypothetical protein
VDPVQDPLPARKSGSAGNRIRDFLICRQELWPLHRITQAIKISINTIALYFRANAVYRDV